MRLIEAQVDGFGKLNKMRCNLDAPLVVLYGPNEAGKSTMFSFVRTMLFGFARRNQLAERQEPIHGGNHGGVLLFRGQDGSRYRLERYAAASGKLLIRTLDSVEDTGFTLSQTDWERRFLGGISERVYRQLFAITLTELQEIGAITGEELGKQLYNAGWEGGQAIAEAQKKLSQEMDVLFKPRGSNQSMNQLLKQLEETDQALRRQISGIDVYNQLQSQLQALDARIGELEIEVPRLQQQSAELVKAGRIRDLWLKQLELAQRRETLAYSDGVSMEGRSSWSTLFEERQRRRERLEELGRELQLLQQKRSGMMLNDALLESADEVESLMLSAESMRQLEQDSRDMNSDRIREIEAVGRLLQLISDDWSEDQLRAFRAGVADREYVREARQAAMEAAKAEERIAAELRALSAQEQEAVYALQGLTAHGEHASVRQMGFVPQTREALKSAWNAFDAALREWELERVRAEPEAGGSRGRVARGGAAPLWAAAAAAGGAALALGAASRGGAGGGSPVLGAGAAVITAAALALGVLAAARARAKPHGSDRSRRAGGGGGLTAAAGTLSAAAGGSARLRERGQRVERALHALVREPGEAAAALLSMPSGAAELDEHSRAAAQVRSELQAAVEGQLEELLRRENDSASREQLSRSLARIREQLAERREFYAAAQHSREAAAQQWRSWLAARELPEQLSPDAALEVFDLAEQALQHLQRADRLAARKRAADIQLTAFREQAAALCTASAEAGRQLAADPALALRLLQAETRSQAALQAEAHRIDERLAELRLAVQDQDLRLTAVQAEMAELIREAGLASEPEFIAALADRAALHELDQHYAKLSLEMFAGMPEERRGRLLELLEAHDGEELERLSRDTMQELQVYEGELISQLDKRGRTRQSLDHLLQEEEQRRLQEQREMLMTKLDKQADRYALLSTTAALLAATKRIYEEERQPAVLREASRYIQIFTQGNYVRVAATPGESTIQLENAQGRMVDHFMLSRGTAEQVYLAMRLALAHEASPDVSLPMLMDDLFVNFDQDRLDAASSVLAELSAHRQVIVLTCHTHVRDTILARNPNAITHTLS
ncbi:AAA family ATPase [Paenibacillus sp. GCM10023252]|uniref:AAA family ATPase n=1 Tax=Paenibacillus sp. GCM10023252 TaxID=3252649 RepID=UPI00361522D0